MLIFTRISSLILFEARLGSTFKQTLKLIRNYYIIVSDISWYSLKLWLLFEIFILCCLTDVFLCWDNNFCNLNLTFFCYFIDLCDRFMSLIINSRQQIMRCLIYWKSHWRKKLWTISTGLIFLSSLICSFHMSCLSKDFCQIFNFRKLMHTFIYNWLFIHWISK